MDCAYLAAGLTGAVLPECKLVEQLQHVFATLCG